jgi:hypothetical protein
MSVWDFFQRRACLALDADWPDVCREFERVGLADIWRFRPYEIDNDKILGPHQSFNASVRQMLVDFLATDSQSMLSMEGDIVFRDLSHLEDALNEWSAAEIFGALMSSVERVDDSCDSLQPESRSIYSRQSARLQRRNGRLLAIETA